MELPRGITGFHRVGELSPPAISLLAFRGLCHAASRELGGQVAQDGGPANSGVANFTGLTLDLPGGAVTVLVNLHHPVVAFAGPGAGNGGPIHFIDAPDLAQHFRQGGAYSVLSSAEACSPVGVEECRLLTEAELKLLRYWRPRCIGDVVFNHWD